MEIYDQIRLLLNHAKVLGIEADLNLIAVTINRVSGKFDLSSESVLDKILEPSNIGIVSRGNKHVFKANKQNVSVSEYLNNITLALSKCDDLIPKITRSTKELFVGISRKALEENHTFNEDIELNEQEVAFLGELLKEVMERELYGL